MKESHQFAYYTIQRLLRSDSLWLDKLTICKQFSRLRWFPIGIWRHSFFLLRVFVFLAWPYRLTYASSLTQFNSSSGMVFFNGIEYLVAIKIFLIPFNPGRNPENKLSYCVLLHWLSMLQICWAQVVQVITLQALLIIVVNELFSCEQLPKHKGPTYKI